jgi:hypothetical protein
VTNFRAAEQGNDGGEKEKYKVGSHAMMQGLWR